MRLSLDGTGSRDHATSMANVNSRLAVKKSIAQTAIAEE